MCHDYIDTVKWIANLNWPQTKRLTSITHTLYTWRVSRRRVNCAGDFPDQYSVKVIYFQYKVPVFSIISPCNDHSHTHTHTALAFDRHFGVFTRCVFGGGGDMKWKCDTQSATAGGRNYVKRVTLGIVGNRGVQTLWGGRSKDILAGVWENVCTYIVGTLLLRIRIVCQRKASRDDIVLIWMQISLK